MLHRPRLTLHGWWLLLLHGLWRLLHLPGGGLLLRRRCRGTPWQRHMRAGNSLEQGWLENNPRRGGQGCVLRPLLVLVELNETDSVVELGPVKIVRLGVVDHGPDILERLHGNLRSCHEAHGLPPCQVSRSGLVRHIEETVIIRLEGGREQIKKGKKWWIFAC